MSESIDDSMEISGTEDMGGFSMPPEGNIAKGTGVEMEFTGEIKMCGEDEDCLMFALTYVDDPSAKANIFCKTTTQSGLSKIVGIGRDSGVFDKIDKVRISKNKPPIQSAEGNVKVKVLTDPKFHNQLRKEIEGCTILCSISHSEAKPYVDKVTGETKEGFPNANISKIASAKKGKATAEKPAKESKPAAAAEDDSDDFG